MKGMKDKKEMRRMKPMTKEVKVVGPSNKFEKEKKLRKPNSLHNLLRLPGNASRDSGQV